MRRFNYLPIAILFLSLFLCVSCEKEKVVVQGGNFQFQEKSYPVKGVKIEHVGYDAEDNFVLRFFAYPATYSEADPSSFGAVLNAYFKSATNDVEIGCEYKFVPEFDSLRSELVIFPQPNKDASYHDTLRCLFSGGSLKVDTLDGFPKFEFRLYTVSGDTVSGTYLGRYAYNYVVDQPSYGSLSFDTLRCQLSAPVMWQWENIFSDDINYFEFIFYSSDSRFSDKGTIMNGIQFVVGINDFQKGWPSVAVYSVSRSSEFTRSLMHGHKLGNASWGTYWQVFNKGSVIGKANVVADSISLDYIDSDNVRMKFDLKDQLGNKVIGTYDGPYTIKSIK